MTQWLFPPRAVPSLPITGGDRRFPVRRILCVGQNYAAHAREMGSDPDKQTPFFFSSAVAHAPYALAVSRGLPRRDTGAE